MTTESEDRLAMVLESEEQDALPELLSWLGREDIDVRVSNVSLSGQLVYIDMDLLTDLQRHTIEVAIEQGYYERPRKADLDTVASELSASRSAVSHRIRSAEAKLIKNAFEEMQ